MMVIDFNVFLYISAGIVNLLGFSNGCAYAWSSPVLPILSLQDTNINPVGYPISSSEGSWIASLLSLGAAIGPLIGGYLSEKFGRKKTLLLFAFPLILSHMINIFATKVIYFCVSRFLLGLGVGVIYCVVPIYVGEISEISNRGFLGCTMSMIYTLGLLFSYSVGPFVSIRVLSILSLIPPILFLIFFGFFIPESPYYLISTNKEKEAEISLRKFRKTNYNANLLSNELEDIKKIVKESQKSTTSFKVAFGSRALQRGLIISNGVMLVQQFTGIAFVIAYMQTIFMESGASIPAHVSSIVVGVIQSCTVFGSLFLVDRLGRKFLVTFSAAGTSLSLGSLGLYFYLKSIMNVGFLWWLPITSFLMYIFAYNSGLGAIPWALLGELFAPNVKSMASTLTTSLSLGEAFLITIFFPHLVNLIGMAASFWIFAVLNIFGIVFLIFCLPETKGKSFEEIADLLNK